jgi:hypothetical protein
MTALRFHPRARRTICMQPPRGSTQLLPARSRRSGRNTEAEVASRSVIGALWSAAICAYPRYARVPARGGDSKLRRIPRMICSPPFTAANKSTGVPEVARGALPVQVTDSRRCCGCSRLTESNGGWSSRRARGPIRRTSPSRCAARTRPPAVAGARTTTAGRGAAQFLADLDGGSIQLEFTLAMLASLWRGGGLRPSGGSHPSARAGTGE